MLIFSLLFAIFCLHLLSVQSEALHSVAVGDHVGCPGVCGQQGLGRENSDIIRCEEGGF